MGDRYFLAELSWRLGPMVVGKAAAGLVSTQRAGAAVLPVWLWLRPKVDMGRKGQGLAPVRVSYEDAGAVGLVPVGSVVDVAWRAVGAGWDAAQGRNPGPEGPGGMSTLTRHRARGEALIGRAAPRTRSSLSPLAAGRQRTVAATSRLPPGAARRPGRLRLSLV